MIPVTVIVLVVHISIVHISLQANEEVPIVLLANLLLELLSGKIYIWCGIDVAQCIW
jgi:hypothetical protein